MPGLLETVQSFVKPLRSAVESARGSSGLGLVDNVKQATGLTLHPLDRAIAMKSQMATKGAVGGSLGPFGLISAPRGGMFKIRSREGATTSSTLAGPILAPGFKTIGYGR